MSSSTEGAQQSAAEKVQPKTAGQLERQLSQEIQALYRSQLGHQPSKVTCQLFDTKLAIIIEDSVTQPVQLLADKGQIDLAEQVRNDLNKALSPQLIDLISGILSVKVLDLLSDVTLQTGRTGIIAILDNVPIVRNPIAIPKVKRGRENSSSNPDESVDVNGGVRLKPGDSNGGNSQ